MQRIRPAAVSSTFVWVLTVCCGRGSGEAPGRVDDDAVRVADCILEAVAVGRDGEEESKQTREGELAEGAAKKFQSSSLRAECVDGSRKIYY